MNSRREETWDTREPALQSQGYIYHWHLISESDHFTREIPPRVYAIETEKSL